MGVKPVSYHKGISEVKIFESRMLIRIFGYKRMGYEAGENCIVNSFMICTPHKVLFR
jgi:hypothetical protein